MARGAVFCVIIKPVIRVYAALVLGAGLLAIAGDAWLRARELARYIPTGEVHEYAVEMVLWGAGLVFAGIFLAFVLATVGYFYAKGLGYKNPGDWALAAVFGGEESLWLLMLTGDWKKLARKEVWRDSDAEDIGRAWMNAHFILFCIFAPAAIAVYAVFVWKGI